MIPRKAYSIPLPGRAPLHLGERTLVMGILNITPDSFADGGRYLDPDRAVAAGLQMIEEGADLLDVGGESTRPGAEPVPAAVPLAAPAGEHTPVAQAILATPTSGTDLTTQLHVPTAQPVRRSPNRPLLRSAITQ